MSRITYAVEDYVDIARRLRSYERSSKKFVLRERGTNRTIFIGEGGFVKYNVSPTLYDSTEAALADAAARMYAWDIVKGNVEAVELVEKVVG